MSIDILSQRQHSPTISTADIIHPENSGAQQDSAVCIVEDEDENEEESVEEGQEGGDDVATPNIDQDLAKSINIEGLAASADIAAHKKQRKRNKNSNKTTSPSLVTETHLTTSQDLLARLSTPVPSSLPRWAGRSLPPHFEKVQTTSAKIRYGPDVTRRVKTIDDVEAAQFIQDHDNGDRSDGDEPGEQEAIQSQRAWDEPIVSQHNVSSVIEARRHLRYGVEDAATVHQSEVDSAPGDDGWKTPTEGLEASPAKPEHIERVNDWGPPPYEIPSAPDNGKVLQLGHHWLELEPPHGCRSWQIYFRRNPDCEDLHRSSDDSAEDDDDDDEQDWIEEAQSDANRPSYPMAPPARSARQTASGPLTPISFAESRRPRPSATASNSVELRFNRWGGKGSAPRSKSGLDDCPSLRYQQHTDNARSEDDVGGSHSESKAWVASPEQSRAALVGQGNSSESTFDAVEPSTPAVGFDFDWPQDTSSGWDDPAPFESPPSQPHIEPSSHEVTPHLSTIKVREKDGFSAQVIDKNRSAKSSNEVNSAEESALLDGLCACSDAELVDANSPPVESAVVFERTDGVTGDNKCAIDLPAHLTSPFQPGQRSSMELIGSAVSSTKGIESLPPPIAAGLPLRPPSPLPVSPAQAVNFVQNQQTPLNCGHRAPFGPPLGDQVLVNNFSSRTRITLAEAISTETTGGTTLAPPTTVEEVVQPSAAESPPAIAGDEAAVFQQQQQQPALKRKEAVQTLAQLNDLADRIRREQQNLWALLEADAGVAGAVQADLVGGHGGGATGGGQ